MGRHDWYRSETWNLDVADAFEAKLARSRTAYDKAQYLRIQGLYLLRSAETTIQECGVALTKRMMRDYPQETGEVACAHETLANYFLRRTLYREAEAELRWLLDYYKTTRNNTSGLADLTLVELILTSKQAAKYAEAISLLRDILESRRPLFNSDLFRLFVAAARLYGYVNDSTLSAEFATKALHLARARGVQFPRHPSIGNVRMESNLERELMMLADASRC